MVNSIKVYNFNNDDDRAKFDSMVWCWRRYQATIISVWNTGPSPTSKDEDFEVINASDIEYKRLAISLELKFYKFKLH